MTRVSGLISLVLAFTIFAAGCDTHSHGDQPAPEMPVVSNASAEDAARSWLLLTQALIRARAHHDEAMVTRVLAEQRRLLLLPKAFTDRITDANARQIIENNLVDNWSAGIAWYAEGYDLTRLRTEPPKTAAAPTEVHVPARGRNDAATIVVVCVSTDQGWRIRGLNLLPESALDSTPAAATATAPAPGSVPASAPAPSP